MIIRGGRIRGLMSIFFKYIIAKYAFQNSTHFVPPCNNDKVQFWDDIYNEWISYEKYAPCCKLTKVLNISNELLPMVMKAMKYSMQPASFKEPSKDFLEVFDNLDFLGDFSNLTKSGQYLIKKNYNPRVFMCRYARVPEEMYADNCDLFQVSLTNGGLGYTFNQADFWKIYAPTKYTKEFARIYWPKGFKTSYSDDNIDEWTNSKDSIFYPVQSGPKNGLTVTDYYIFTMLFTFSLFFYCCKLFLGIFTRTQKLSKKFR